MLRLTTSVQEDHTVPAVLDMRGAYPGVSRYAMATKMRNRLPENVPNMTSPFLSPDTISTLGDETKKERILPVGIPEGSPLSPCLFTISIDILSERLDCISPMKCAWPASIFAEDGKLRARSVVTDCRQLGGGLQHALGPFEVLYSHKERDHSPYKIAGHFIPVLQSTKYQGCDIDSRGIKSKSLSRRINAAL